MPQSVQVILEGDNCWPDLQEKFRQQRVLDLMGNDVPAIQFAALPRGMASGRTSVTLRLDSPNGTVVLTELSLAMLGSVTRAIEARYEYDVAQQPTANPAERIKALLGDLEVAIMERTSEDRSSLQVVSAIVHIREELEHLQRWVAFHEVSKGQEHGNANEN